MFEAGLLNLVLFLPLLGVAVLLLAPSATDETSRRLTLIVMLVQLMITSWLYTQFDAGTRACSSRPASPGLLPGA
jgi:NADH:ubiquinone oxidoreductase subunit 4 (subunit M)